MGTATSTFAALTILDPTSQLEITKYASVSCALQTATSNEGKTGVFKLREGHVTGSSQTGTVHDSDQDEVNSEGQASVTLEPMSGTTWPAAVGVETEVHIEAKVLLDNNNFEIANCNILVEADPM